MEAEQGSPSYYSVLGVSSDSSIEDIRRAYRKLAMVGNLYHLFFSFLDSNFHMYISACYIHRSRPEKTTRFRREKKNPCFLHGDNEKKRCIFLVGFLCFLDYLIRKVLC